MMFKDDYKNQLDSIKPDGYIKDKVRRKISKETEHKKINFGMYFARGLAAVLVFAVIFSAGIIIGKQAAPAVSTVNKNTTLLKSVKNYDAIYKALSEFKPNLFAEIELFSGGTKNWAVDEDAVEYGAVEGSMNGSAKPGASADKGDMSNVADDAEGNTASPDSSKEHSETTTQVEGVDEADIVKTDGNFIYVLSGSSETVSAVKVIDIRERTPKKLAETEVKDIYGYDMYLSGGRLVVIGATHGNVYARSHVPTYVKTIAVIYDVSDPSKPTEKERIEQSGSYNTSRLIGDKLYLISNYDVKINDIDRKKPETLVPNINCKDYDGAVESDTVHIYDNCSQPTYTVISGYEIKEGCIVSSRSLLGGSYTVYASTENIITAGNTEDNETQVARFTIADGIREHVAGGKLNGSLLNQFSIDEYKNHFRFVLTGWQETKTKFGGTVQSQASSLVILDKDLKETGKITDIAPGERVYSVRFMGEVAYFVTFRQVDPLFSVDVSNPKEPKIIGSLKIPGFSNYLFPFGEGKLLGIGKNADEKTGRSGSVKLSMFDISDPSNVTEGSKTDLPANDSEALYNHKANLVDYEKNIIAFPTYGYSNENEYNIYSFVNGKFELRSSIKLGWDYSSVLRGIYSGDIFYIVTDRKVIYLEMKSFTKLGEADI